ncbi:hypothetical protein ACF3M1_01310 [Luteimonas sp. WGS1318]|uniref:hypothetical protein n=1 Tax=Luteimonas sp. WGS1318 TaxID=3366815 RepID=UPI00372D7B21
MKHNAGVATSMYLKLIGTGVLFAMLSWLFLSMRPPTLELAQYPAYIASKLLLAAIFAFALWGWDFLDRHARHLVSGTPLVWIMYFGFKLMLSVMIGIVVGPYQIFRMIKEVRLVRRTSRAIADGVI